MSLTSNAEILSQKPLFRVRNTLPSAKEAVGKHPGAKTVREVDWDSRKGEQRLPNRDPFYDVGWKSRRKQNIGFWGLADAKVYKNYKEQWTMCHSSFDQNGGKSSKARKVLPAVTQKFRVVRDNRNNHNSVLSVEQESAQDLDIGNEQIACRAANSGNLVEPEVSPSVEQFVSCQDHSSLEFSIGDREIIPKLKLTTPCLHSKADGNTGNNNEMQFSVLASATLAIGMYSSATDPVHVPSADSRTAGTIGTVRQKVGVVGCQRLTCINSSTKKSVANDPCFINLPQEDLSSSTESFGLRCATPKTSSLCNIPSSEPIMFNTTIGRGFATDRPSSSSKPNQQVLTHQKAVPSNMEWRPKSSQNSRILSSHSQCGSLVEAADLSEKLSLVNFSDSRHVIIPKHLRVPEAERRLLKFGSFGNRFDSLNVSPTLHACESSDKSSARMSMSSPISLHKNNAILTKVDLVNSNLASPQTDSSPSIESEPTLIARNESLSPKTIFSYADIDVLQCQESSVSSVEPHKPENLPSLHCFLGYDQQPRDFTQFSKVAIDENTQQSLSLASEVLGSNETCNNHQSSGSVQIQPSHLYSQVDVSHLTNFVPYQHIMAPMYMPPLAMPVYPENHTYPPNGNSCLFIPGGNHNIAAGGMNFKYAAQQHKPVPIGGPVGYASYGCPAASVDDATRFKYIDSGMYIPNPQGFMRQAEASNIWLQTTRELAALHPPSHDLFSQVDGRLFHGHGGGAHSPACLQYHPSLQGPPTCPPLQLIRHQISFPSPNAPPASYPRPHVGWATATF